jgi:Fe2+ transport system protein B
MTVAGSLAGLGQSFVRAIVLTLEEIVNLIPRTLNLIPGLHLPEADFLGQQVQDASNSGLESALGGAFTPAAALAFVAFILLYVPCMSATAAMKHEFDTRWMLIQVGYTLTVAWLVAVAIFQVGSLAGF